MATRFQRSKALTSSTSRWRCGGSRSSAWRDPPPVRRAHHERISIRARVPFVLSQSKDERPYPAYVQPALSPVEGQANRKGQLTS